MKHVTDRIQALVSGELDGELKAEVMKHVSECSACRAEVGRVREMWEMLDRASSSPQSGGSVWPAVQARTFGAGNSEREWFFGAGRLTRSVLATATVATGLVLGVLLPGGAVQDSPADSGLVDSSWLVESSWLSGSSWQGGDYGTAGLDDILLGADLTEEGNGS